MGSRNLPREAAVGTREEEGSASTRESLLLLSNEFADPAAPLHAEDPLVIAPDAERGTGSAPHVLISAPHSAPHERGDRILPPEYGTGALAVSLARSLGCAAICKTSPQGDANWDAESPYRDRACEIIREHGIRALIDLHQMRAERLQSFEVGSGHGANVHGRRDLVGAVAGELEATGLGRVVVDGLFSASKSSTVSASVSHNCQIPCVQIEINSGLVMDPDRFARVLDALSRIAGRLEGLTA